MIPIENKNTIQFKQRLLPNCLPHDIEIVTVNGGESTSQYHTWIIVAKFTGKQKKIKSSYFIATPCMLTFLTVFTINSATSKLQRSTHTYPICHTFVLMTFCLKNLKGFIKRAHSDNAVHMKHITEHLHGISEGNLQDYFEIWKNRREKYVTAHRDYSIGTSFEPCNFSTIKVLLPLSHFWGWGEADLIKVIS